MRYLKKIKYLIMMLIFISFSYSIEFDISEKQVKDGIVYRRGEKNSFTLYISNDIKTKRIISSRHDDLKNLAKRTYQLPFNQDIVIKGLGFIKVVNRGVVDIYLNQRVETFLRDNLI